MTTLDEALLGELKGLIKEVQIGENVLQDHIDRKRVDSNTATLWMDNVRKIYRIKEIIAELREGELEDRYLLQDLIKYRNFSIYKSKVHMVILICFIHKYKEDQRIEDFFFKEEYKNYTADDTWWDFSDGFYTYTNSVGFYQRKIELGIILLDRSLPDKLKKYYDAIKFSFCYGCDIAALGLCRVLIEISFKVKYKKIFRDSNKKEDTFKIIERFCDEKKHILRAGFKERSLEIYKKTCDILHGEYVEYDEEDTTEIIRDTFMIVEGLYTLF